MAIIAAAKSGTFPGPYFTVHNHDGRKILIVTDVFSEAGGCLSTSVHITPDQARALAAALLSVAGPASLAEAA